MPSNNADRRANNRKRKDVEGLSLDKINDAKDTSSSSDGSDGDEMEPIEHPTIAGMYSACSMIESKEIKCANYSTLDLVNFFVCY